MSLDWFAGSNVSAYVNMVCDLLKNSLPKAAVHCQVVEAKRSLLDHFYTQVGKREVLFSSNLFGHLKWFKVMIVVVWDEREALLGQSYVSAPWHKVKEDANNNVYK
jgi:hypothetical protein